MKHETTVEYDANVAWRAECSCGWVARFKRGKPEIAERDAEAHKTKEA